MPRPAHHPGGPGGLEGKGAARGAAALALALATSFVASAHVEDVTAAPTRRLGVPLDSARFRSGDRLLLHGVSAGDVSIDAVSLGETTFTLESGRLHEIAGVRVSARGADGAWRLLSDEELASGPAPARLVGARDLDTWPSSALDALGSLSVSTMLVTDGSAAVRVDVLFPTGLKDDKAGTVDRAPEVILVGAVPTGDLLLGAIVAGDIDDPTLAPTAVDVPPHAFTAGLSGLAMLYGTRATATPIAMVGFDLDDLGVGDGSALGFRLEVPPGVSVACKVFGAGDAITEVLASASLERALAGMIGDGLHVGYEPASGTGDPGPLPLPPFSRLPPLGGGGGIGGGGGGASPPGNLPSPGAVVTFLGAVAIARSRRRLA